MHRLSSSFLVNKYDNIPYYFVCRVEKIAALSSADGSVKGFLSNLRDLELGRYLTRLVSEISCNAKI